MVTTRSKSRSLAADPAPAPAPAAAVLRKKHRGRCPIKPITTSSSATTLVASSGAPTSAGSHSSSSGTATPASPQELVAVSDDDSDFVSESSDDSGSDESDFQEPPTRRRKTARPEGTTEAELEDQLAEAIEARAALYDELEELLRNERASNLQLNVLGQGFGDSDEQTDTDRDSVGESEELQDTAVKDQTEQRGWLEQQHEEATREYASRRGELAETISSLTRRVQELTSALRPARASASGRSKASRARARKRSKVKEEEDPPIDAPPEGDMDYFHRPELFLHHPQLKSAWKSLPGPPEMQMVEQPPNLKIRLLPFQREGVWWMARQEGTQFRGGVLADEMGMGKTLQTIGLMLVNRGKPTLVICPTVALMQWKSEIEAATDDLSVFMYYGTDRQKLADENGDLNPSELVKYDVVLTTYAVVESSFRRERYGFRRHGNLLHEDSVLHKVDWHRIVLDEAHNIKDRSSNSARAAFELKAKYTWSLTGTPLHNRVGELYSLIRMTRCSPFAMYFNYKSDCTSLSWPFHKSKTCSQCSYTYMSHFCYWNYHVMNPIQKNPINSDKSRMAFAKLNKLLDNVMLRRTKVERAKDMGLPPRIIQTRRDKFSPEEEDFYV
ncbi:DNA repair protein rad16, partial [Linderina pennispora]